MRPVISPYSWYYTQRSDLRGIAMSPCLQIMSAFVKY